MEILHIFNKSDRKKFIIDEFLFRDFIMTLRRLLKKIKEKVIEREEQGMFIYGFEVLLAFLIHCKKERRTKS